MPDSDYILDLQTSNRKTNAPLAVINKDVTYGSHYSHWGIGGYTELPSIEYRNAIPSADSISEDLFSSGRRKFGMVVYVISENKYYQLIPREINETDPTKPGTPVSLKKWLFYRGAKKTILLNPEKQGLDDFDDGTVVDELGEFGSPGAVDAATYDVISGSGDPNHCWTEVFVKDNFGTVDDLQDYVDSNTAAYAGQICSVIDTNKIYLIADDGSGTLSFIEFSGSSVGGTELFTENIVVSIADGKTFGRYVAGNTIPASGLSPIDVIKMACFEALPPEITFTSASSVAFGQTDLSIVLNFSYLIESLGGVVSEVKIERKRSDETSWVTILNNTASASPFTDAFTQSKYNTAQLNYQITVEDDKGGVKTVPLNINPTPYVKPSISGVSVVSISRNKGDIATTYTGTISKNSALVPVIHYQLQRKINSGAWTSIGSQSFVTGNPSTVSVNIQDDASSDPNVKNADQLSYRIIVEDDYATSTLSETTITFYHRCGVILKDGGLTLADIDSASSMVLQDTKARTVSGVTSGNAYTYYVYKSSAGDLTSISQGVLPVLTAFTKQPDITGTNAWGATVSYRVYKSNSKAAFSGAALIFS